MVLVYIQCATTVLPLYGGGLGGGDSRKPLAYSIGEKMSLGQKRTAGILFLGAVKIY